MKLSDVNKETGVYLRRMKVYKKSQYIFAVFDENNIYKIYLFIKL